LNKNEAKRKSPFFIVKKRKTKKKTKLSFF
jgi:hypothetical protein